MKPKTKKRGTASTCKRPRLGKVPSGNGKQKQSRRYRRVRLPSKWWKEEMTLEFGDDHSAYTRVVVN